MIKKFSIFLLSALLSAGAWAYDFCAVCSSGQMLYYNINNDGTVTLTYAGSAGRPYNETHPAPEGVLVVPSEVGGKTVSAIGNQALQGSAGLTSITVPASVTSIGTYAFAYCTSLEEVILPASITMIPGHMCCGCTSLESITIPSSVTSIGEVAFDGCESLAAIAFPNSVTYIGSSAFSDCTSLASVDFNQVKVVDYSAFNGCIALSTITIPESVDTLRFAFNDCTGLRSIVLNAPNCIMGDGYSGAFPVNEYITSVIIGPNVRHISDYAFQGFKVLETLVIPDNVQTIGEEAFGYALGLRSLIVGSGVRSIGDYAFAGISEVDSIVLRCIPPAIQSGTFSIVPRDKPLHVPCGQESAYAAAEYWSDFTNIIEDCGVSAINKPNQYRIVTTVRNQQISVLVDQPMEMRVVDGMGRVVFDEEIQSMALISVPARGLYVLQTSNGASVKVVVL